MTQRGLYEKYAVQRRVEPDNAEDDVQFIPVEEFCFVLVPSKDPIARDALKVYAGMAHLQGYERLAEDLINIVWDLEHPEHAEEKAKPGVIDTRPRIYAHCGQCRLRIWQHAGEQYWHHEDLIQATIVGGGGHKPWPEEVELPEELDVVNEGDKRPPVAPEPIEAHADKLT